MAIAEGRFCIFCGETPDGKTREHVLPYWLLEMTGDPTRVVAFGQDFSRQQQTIRYSWSNYVAPACDTCNNKYSALEARIKPRIQALQHREVLSVADYVDVLDWLDKVRIGVWFIRHMIENHPVTITPHFHIDTRVAQKDRMVALYAFGSSTKGITLFGADSLIFNDMPSCFGLRISNPITRLRLFKPVVWLYQPIKLLSTNQIFQGGYEGHFNLFDSRLAEHTLEGSDRLGALFRQYSNHVEVHMSLSDLVEFDEVVGDDCALQKDIAASVYEAQLAMLNAVTYEWHLPASQRKGIKAYRKIKIKNTERLARMYHMGRIALQPSSNSGGKK